ncbi:TPA: hypothetical protein NK329_003128 [Vibrio parahaemolyticus]|nr:hypothetical protein [Vibrio parahaemolyticus]
MLRSTNCEGSGQKLASDFAKLVSHELTQVGKIHPINFLQPNCGKNGSQDFVILGAVISLNLLWDLQTNKNKFSFVDQFRFLATNHIKPQNETIYHGIPSSCSEEEQEIDIKSCGYFFKIA